MKKIKVWIFICLTILLFCCRSQNTTIRFFYLGHSSFLIFFDEKTSVLTDYGKANAWIDYGWDSPVNNIGDFIPTVITYSHTHDDHYDSTRIPGDVDYILKSPDTLTVNNLYILPVATSENDIHEKNNTSYLFEYEGIKIMHLGDCQANIINVDSADNKKYIKNNIPADCDVLLMPIEGTSKYIPQAESFINIVQPKIIIPMHYWSEAYKKDFFDYLHNQKDKKYRIVNLNTSEFVYTYREKTDSIYVININPSEFNNKK